LSRTNTRKPAAENENLRWCGCHLPPTLNYTAPELFVTLKVLTGLTKAAMITIYD
jgi:hypothetical protein